MALGPMPAPMAIHFSWVLSLGGNSEGNLPGSAAPRLTALIHIDVHPPLPSGTSMMRLAVRAVTNVTLGRSCCWRTVMVEFPDIRARYESAVESRGTILSA